MSANNSSSSSRRVSGGGSGLSGGELTETTARIALAAPPVGKPSASLKQRLVARIHESAAASATVAAQSGWRFTPMAAGGDWVRLPIPGVRIRELTIDAARDVALLYVEMAAGAVFPEHEHTAPERGVVLRGDFQTGDRLLHAGDFYEAATGTRHERISSPSGCEGLLWVSVAGWRRWRAALTAER